ncbi:MAG TPA: Rv2231c family pyridoxal phosphate-dependent protein CobC [Micromonosporaceae bacterium]
MSGNEWLRHHGDQELAPGLMDLAVNVRHAPMPSWLAAPLRAALADLSRYPDPAAARAAVAARHRRDPAQVLLTAGAAEAFVLLARHLRPRHAVVVHPQFTEPEVALRSAGHRVTRVVLTEADGFTLTPDRVPVRSDLVLIGNPTNPTSVLHPADVLAGLARRGRILVVDEAFADTVATPEPQSLASRSDLPGVVVVRSLTKTWGLAGLRAGYLLAGAELVRGLAEAQPLWPVSTPALAAIEVCSTPAAVAQERRLAFTLAEQRAHLVDGLRRLGITVAGTPVSSFVLVRVAGATGLRAALRERGFAVRRGDTFPGLGPDWLRITVREQAVSDALLAALAELVPGNAQ